MIDERSEKRRGVVKTRLMQVTACAVALFGLILCGCQTQMTEGAADKETMHQEEHAAEHKMETKAPQGGMSYGEASWQNGNLERTFVASLDETYAAARKAVGAMGMSIQEQQKDAPNARIMASGGPAGQVHIAISETGFFETRVRVRTGFMGDREASNKVMERIDSEL